MDSFKITLRYFGLFILTIFLSFLFAEKNGDTYRFFFPHPEFWVDPSWVSGFFLDYSFFLPFFFVFGGGKGKYKWLTGFFIPSVILLFGSKDVWLFILLAFAGWALGWGILKLWTAFFKTKA